MPVRLSYRWPNSLIGSPHERRPATLASLCLLPEIATEPFWAGEVSSRSEVQDALARMQTIVSQRMRDKVPRGSRDSREESGGADQHTSYARMTRPGMHGSGGAE